MLKCCYDSLTIAADLMSCLKSPLVSSIISLSRSVAESVLFGLTTTRN